MANWRETVTWRREAPALVAAPLLGALCTLPFLLRSDGADGEGLWSLLGLALQFGGMWGVPLTVVLGLPVYLLVKYVRVLPFLGSLAPVAFAVGTLIVYLILSPFGPDSGWNDWRHRYLKDAVSLGGLPALATAVWFWAIIRLPLGAR